MQGYKSILVHVTPEEAAGARLALAADLAERFDSHLIGLGAGCINLPVDAMGDGSAAAAVVEIETEDLVAALRGAETRFRKALGQHGAKVEWRCFQEFPAGAIAREARAADLVVLGREWAGGSANFSLAANPGDVVLRAGRPVLVVPPGIDRLEASRVVIAWKDTREARRAVRDALPLLQGAERVSVVEICEEEEQAEQAAARAEDVARYLVRHGIGARGSAQRMTERSAAAQIERVAQAEGADLIVAGGYGHARLREWVFGGVTRELLRGARCCLLSH
ncbi:Nucleotide-binding universal stress protein, UspA family [Roseomonas rosea]|uniref:Nucleotide-binding universal stress protein, UspA family n=1 Tax=Muricoccus roseus TaxID=198092 RepID=A0A1M6RE29_9PROT|nr:universal stress protein [Roseomonas rosea]SHK30650.1 Nucleotide-binding universal stress protein, UspA family [Roseomonas rosea]